MSNLLSAKQALNEDMSTEEVFVQQFVRLFHHYREALSPEVKQQRWPWRRATTAALGLMLYVCGSSMCAQTNASSQTSGQEECPQLRQEVQELPGPIYQLQSEHTAQSGRVPAPNLDSAVGQQTLRGRVTCAKLSVVSYTCGHSKNEPVWGCTLHCAKGPDGSQYVLQIDNKTYSVTGDPNQLRHFVGDDVVVSGEASGYEIRAFTIAKPSRKASHTYLGIEPKTR